jgi:hypothetical protein
VFYICHILDCLDIIKGVGFIIAILQIWLLLSLSVGIVMSQPPQYKCYAATVTSAAGATAECGKQQMTLIEK